MCPSRMRVLSTAVLLAIPALAQAQAELGFEPEPRPHHAATMLPLDAKTAGAGLELAQKKEDATDKPAVVSAGDCRCVTDPFRGRLSLRHDFGDGVGYDRGFSYIEAMLPIRSEARSLSFIDLRLVNFDHEERWEYNVGAGYRWLNSNCTTVLGVNGFYDARKTDHHAYQQIGVGLEALRRCVEFRANGYFIVGPSQRLIGDTGPVFQGIVNNNLVFQQQKTTEFAYSGLDAEAGILLPFLERYAPRAYLGAYSYWTPQTTTTYGARGRLEAQLSERIALHFSIQHDKVFDTTVTGGLAIHFGAPAFRRGTGVPSWSDVLQQRVHRDVNVVINQGTTTTTTTFPIEIDD